MSPFASAAFNASALSTAHILQSSGPINAATLPVYEFTTYKPAGSGLVWSNRQDIFYYPAVEAMYGVTNRYLEAMDWIQGIAWENHSKADQVYQYSFETALTVIQGNEVSLAVNVGASFFGMSIAFDFAVKTFKSTETTTTRSTTVTITVPPESHLVFYQKRYTFRDEMSFICDESNQYFNVGTYGKSSPLTTKISKTTIMAEEYFTAIQPLRADKTGTVNLQAVTPYTLPSLSKSRDGLSTRAKDVLTKLRV